MASRQVSGTITTVKDMAGNVKIPRTSSEAVSMVNGDTVEEAIQALINENLELRSIIESLEARIDILEHTNVLSFKE